MVHGMKPVFKFSNLTTGCWINSLSQGEFIINTHLAYLYDENPIHMVIFMTAYEQKIYAVH